MSDHRHAPAGCPTCGAANDAATYAGEGSARPAPGDLSVCLYCGEWRLFDDALRPTIKATEEDQACAPAELLERAREIRRLWQARHTH